MSDIHSQNPLLTTLSIPLAACIEAIGYERFYPRFFALIGKITRIDQYMVFEFCDKWESPRCRLAHNVHRPELGLQLASLYLEGNYLNDPLLERLANEITEHPTQPACELLLSRTLPPVYRRRFFNVPDIKEKFAIAANDEESGRLYYINFYRSAEREFAANEIEGLEQCSALISALLLRHFREERQGRGVQKHLLAAGLSEREAQICELIVAGHTTKTIARKLNLAESSIITYRKRAYQKLGVHRKPDLLEIFQG